LAQSPEQYDDFPPVDAYTKDFFTNRSAELLDFIGIASDPFNLDSDSRSKLQSILDSVESEKPLVIFMGRAYDGLEVVNVRPSYYLCPLGYSGDPLECYGLVSGEDYSAEELISYMPDEIQQEVMRIFYDAVMDGDASSQPGRLAPFLDSKASAGDLERWHYSQESDLLNLVYPQSEASWELEPRYWAETMKYIIDSASKPEAYSEGFKDSLWESADETHVIILSNTEDPYHYPRTLLSSELSTLLSSGSKEDKLSELAGPVRVVMPGTMVAGGQNFQSPTGAAVAGSGANDLLNRPGAIVSPTRQIFHFRAGDYYDDKSSYVTDHFLDPERKFKPFHENDYLFKQRIVTLGSPGVEDLAALLSNTEESIVFMFAHGGYAFGKYGNNIEYYDLGNLPDKIVTPVINVRQMISIGSDTVEGARFLSRLRKLKNDYGKDSVEGAFRPFRPTNRDAEASMRRSIGRLYNWFKNRHFFAVIGVNEDFFSHQLTKKSLFIFLACQGGAIAGKSREEPRVLLAAPYITNWYLFGWSDLLKINEYLLKSPEPGNIRISEGNMRNYDILNSFAQNQVDLKGIDPKTKDGPDAQCFGTKDALCTIRLYGTPGQTISVSPHVKSVSGERIEFNAPMETDGIKAEAVVTIDSSQCTGASQESLQLKPEWAGSDGDKEISLPWMDKVYRDWEASDDPERVNKAAITVHNARAVSKSSRVRLTGNPDCCTKDSCKEDDYWREPDTIECNGNQPKSDFVFMMPCIERVYYEACEDSEPKYLRFIDEAGLYGGNYPYMIRHDGDCYSLSRDSEPEGVSALELKEVEEDKSCDQICAPSAPLASPCMGPIVEIRRPSNDYTYEAIYVDDQLVTTPFISVKEGDYTIGGWEVAAFAGRAAYTHVGPYCKSEVCTHDDPCYVPCEKWNNYEIVYDGSPIYSYTRDGLNYITDFSLYGDSIYVRFNNYDAERGSFEKVFYNGEIFEFSKSMGRADCVLSTTGILCVDNEDNIWYNNKMLGKTGRPVRIHQPTNSYHPNSAYNSYPRPGSGIYIFNDNVAFLDNNNQLKLFKKGKQILSVSGPHLYMLFGEHLAYLSSDLTSFEMDDGTCISQSVIYDGYNLGPGEDFIIFGDSIAFSTSCNLQTKKMGTWIFWDGKYHDVDQKLGIPYEAHFGQISEIGLFGENLAFVISIYGEDHLVYNWKNLGKIDIYAEKYGHRPYLLFGDHIVFVRKVGDESHIIYDGVDIGTGYAPFIYADHLSYYPSLAKSSESLIDLVFDGNTIPGEIHRGDDSTSIPDNMMNCYRYYLETEVPTSPYGSVTF